MQITVAAVFLVVCTSSELSGCWQCASAALRWTMSGHAGQPAAGAATGETLLRCGALTEAAVAEVTQQFVPPGLVQSAAGQNVKKWFCALALRDR